MNPFSKNPFANKETKTNIVGNKIQFDEKQKLEKIKETMTKLQYQNNQPNELKEPSLKEKIDILRDLNK